MVETNENCFQVQFPFFLHTFTIGLVIRLNISHCYPMTSHTSLKKQVGVAGCLQASCGLCWSEPRTGSLCLRPHFLLPGVVVPAVLPPVVLEDVIHTLPPDGQDGEPGQDRPQPILLPDVVSPWWIEIEGQYEHDLYLIYMIYTWQSGRRWVEGVYNLMDR